MIELFLKGGPVMLLLAGCSLLGVYIIVQKLLFFQFNVITRTKLMGLKQAINTKGRRLVAEELAEKKDTISRLMSAAVSASAQSIEEARERLSEMAVKEVPKYEKNLSLLSSIITVAPILGLLGTVLGLMDVFNVISGGGLGDANQLSSGIAEALISTVVGLSITIPFIFAHHYLSTQVDQRVAVLDTTLRHIVVYCKKQEGGES